MGGSSPPDLEPLPRTPSPIDPLVSEARRRARRKARSPLKSTVFSSPLGVTKRATVGTPTLMGGTTALGGTKPGAK